MAQLSIRDYEAIKTEQEYRQARKSFYEYVKIANDGYIPSKFHEYLCNTTQAFLEKHDTPSIDVLLLSVPPQHGKLLAHNTPVLTTKGWTTHGDLEVGDQVFGLNGEPVTVTHLHPESHANMVVELSNGETLRCHENHEWVVYDDNGELRTYETKELLDFKHKVRLPSSVRIHDIKKERTRLHAYEYGLWLGSQTTNATIQVQIDHYSYILPYLTYHPSIAKVNTDGTMNINLWGLKTDLIKEKIYDERQIPDRFIFLSYAWKLDLIRGLIDSHAVYKEGMFYYFESRDESLLYELYALIASIGGYAVLLHKKIKFQIEAPLEIRMRHKEQSQGEYDYLYIDHIYYGSESDKTKGRCITVDGGIYRVGYSLTATHNSLTITETLPSWYCGMNPDKDCIIVSYSDDTVSRFGRSNRSKLERFSTPPYDVVSPLFRNYKQGEVWTSTDIANDKGKYVRSRGIFGGITSNPADLIIIDDPIKTMQEARSETTKEAIWREYFASIRTRLKPYGKLIVIATRWAEDDLIGRLLTTVHARRLTTVFMPCECVDEDNDPLGRSNGDSLCPEIGRTNEWLQDFKSEYIGEEGLFTWSALYQCDPTPVAGAIIKPEWWKFYDRSEDLEFSNTYISVDCTFKGGAKSDFVVVQAWSMVGYNYYLREQDRDHYSFTETLDAIRYMADRYPDYIGILIEDKANGSAVIDSLQHEYEGIIPVTPAGGKESRVHACSKLIRQGRVYLPRGASFVDSYINEFTSFPNAKFDDQVDTTSQVLNYLLYSVGENTSKDNVKDVIIKIREWTSDMYEDYYRADPQQRQTILRLWGYPEHGFYEEDSE